MILADLGTSVVKVERPNRGDEARQFGPPYLKDAQCNDTSEAAYYLAVNRGKESLSLDLSKPEGQPSPGRIGNTHPSIVPYQAFTTADGHIVGAVSNDRQFERFCRAVGRPELARTPRFATNIERVPNRTRLIPLLKEDHGGPLHRRLALGVRRGRVSVRPDQHHRRGVRRSPGRGARHEVELPQPLGGVVSLVGSPLRLSETPVTYRRAPPLLGEHSDAILRELGHTDANIARPRENGVI